MCIFYCSLPLLVCLDSSVVVLVTAANFMISIELWYCQQFSISLNRRAEHLLGPYYFAVTHFYSIIEQHMPTKTTCPIQMILSSPILPQRPCVLRSTIRRHCSYRAKVEFSPSRQDGNPVQTAGPWPANTVP